MGPEVLIGLLSRLTCAIPNRPIEPGITPRVERVGVSRCWHTASYPYVPVKPNALGLEQDTVRIFLLLAAFSVLCLRRIPIAPKSRSSIPTDSVQLVGYLYELEAFPWSYREAGSPDSLR